MDYTCNNYREEMQLLSLRKRLEQANLSDEEKNILRQQIFRMEKEMGMQ